MRVIVGVIAGLGLVVTVAVAQPPAERAAVLKPPVPLPHDQMPPVARGVAGGFPATASAAALASTPITRPNAAPGRNAPGVATGPPAWLGGVDPNVLPAAGTSAKGGNVRPLTSMPAGATKAEAPTQPKFMDRLKGAGGDKQPAPQPLPQHLQQNTQLGQPTAPTANTAFRSTGANGAPVYAGPPAYRWYGWGTVTPGANPLAPAGQYPKASANWYSITGATPGAFPVPVSNDARVAPGIEPPTYGLARTNVAAQPTVPASTQQSWPQQQPAYKPWPQPTWQQRPEVPAAKSPTESKFQVNSSVGMAPAPNFTPPPAPVSVPTMTAPPVAASLPAPTVPTMSPAPATPTAPKSDPVAVLPPLPAIPVGPAAPVVPSAVPPVVPSVEPAKIALPTTEPKPLPTSVTTEPPRDEFRWQTAPESTTPQPGTWTPAQGVQPLPTKPADQPSPWQSGSATVKPVVARGQMSDRTPDPIAALIKRVCQGRADGVEVRWVGTKKLQVCFEIRTATEAQKLVADISKQSELTSYQIDFCVLVK